MTFQQRLNLGIFKRPWLAMAAIGGMWGMAAATGMVALCSFDAKPGRAAASAMVWPAEVSIQRIEGEATLVMAVHPNCPCSRASVGELSLLMEQWPKRIRAYVLFSSAPGLAQDPATSDLWKTAAAIPGVEVIRDGTGIATGIFHAKTSGQVFFYDSTGRLRFQGGITAARGHAGDNDGRAAIESLLSSGVSWRTTTPVYGCSLQ